MDDEAGAFPPSITLEIFAAYVVLIYSGFNKGVTHPLDYLW
jgi:hypothetical protein